MEKQWDIDERDRLEEETEAAGTKIKNTFTDAAGVAREKAEGTGRAIQGKIDSARGPAADKLQQAASKVHQRADNLPGVQTFSNFAHSAADRMETTAQYLREHEVKDMLADVEGFVRKHPAQSLLVAAVGGFLVGRAFRRADDY
jgi:ElaB/YqjD/DUF883 family membrane-anchored ribosome-binding protein